MLTRTCGRCVGQRACKIYVMWDEDDETTTKICGARLAQMEKLFGPIPPQNKRRLRSMKEHPELELVGCGCCVGRESCEMFLVWDPVNQVRVQMCTALQQKMLPVYGEANDVELVVDPACDNFRSAVYAHDGGYYTGEFCTKCESRVDGERSPGIRAENIVLCRLCFTETDEQVLEQQTSTTVNGVNKLGEDVSLAIPSFEWALLRLVTDLTVPQIVREYNHAAKWNQRIIDTLWQRLQQLSLDGPD